MKETLVRLSRVSRVSRLAVVTHNVFGQIEDEFDFPVSPLKRTFKDIDAKDEFWLWTRGCVGLRSRLAWRCLIMSSLSQPVLRRVLPVDTATVLGRQCASATSRLVGA